MTIVVGRVTRLRRAQVSRAQTGAGAAPPVGVVGRQRLGPFDVARLTATDPGALGGWLDRNGFALPPRLDGALRPYVRKRWEYVAVKPAPRSPGEPLAGALDPLHLTFRADEPVYPMRLSRLADPPGPWACTSWPRTAWNRPPASAANCPVSPTPAG